MHIVLLVVMLNVMDEYVHLSCRECVQIANLIHHVRIIRIVRVGIVMLIDKTLLIALTLIEHVLSGNLVLGVMMRLIVSQVYLARVTIMVIVYVKHVVMIPIVLQMSVVDILKYVAKLVLQELVNHVHSTQNVRVDIALPLSVSTVRLVIHAPFMMIVRQETVMVMAKVLYVGINDNI